MTIEPGRNQLDLLATHLVNAIPHLARVYRGTEVWKKKWRQQARLARPLFA